ncbi:MAG: hypothetical protein DRQ55_07390 [Planctomycetota bacterium]|nr:MAG: hypothetical protein DRQ55_07390 [Planctomycetota bacterium]
MALTSPELLTMLRALLLSLLAVPLFSASLQAAPFTTHSDALIAELEQRRDNDFGGTLDKLQKKQQKAVLVALKTFAKNSKGPKFDLKFLNKGAKKLSKAYVSEFDGISPDQTLSGLVFGAVLGLRNDAVERQQEHWFVVPTLGPAGLVKKGTKLNAKLSDVLGGFQPETSPFGRIKITIKAYGLLKKLDKLASKDKGTGEYLVFGRKGGTPTVTEAPFVEWKAANDELQLFGVFTNPLSGSQATVAVIMQGVTAPGSYDFTGGGWSGFYSVGSGFNVTTYEIVPGSGALLIEQLDIPGSVVKGSFSFDAKNDGNGVTLVFDDCRFRLTDIVVQ